MDVASGRMIIARDAISASRTLPIELSEQTENQVLLAFRMNETSLPSTRAIRSSIRASTHNRQIKAHSRDRRNFSLKHDRDCFSYVNLLRESLTDSILGTLNFKPDQRMVNKVNDFTIPTKYAVLSRNKLTHLQVLIGLTRGACEPLWPCRSSSWLVHPLAFYGAHLCTSYFPHSGADPSQSHTWNQRFF